MRAYVFGLVGLAAFTAAGSAGAMPAAVPGHPRMASQATQIQFRDAQVYYDAKGNRVIVDPDTGEVLAVQPPRWRIGPRGERRAYRERPRRDRYEVEDPDDAPRVSRRGRFRAERRQPPPDDDIDGQVTEGPDIGDIINEGPVDGGPLDGEGAYGSPRDDARTYQQEEFPEAPEQPRYRDPQRRQPAQQARRRDIERAPLPTPAPLPDTADEPAAVPQDTTGAVASTEPPPADTAIGSNPPVSTAPSAPAPLNFTAREDVASIQILMDRGGASPGVIDGKFGSNVDKALAAYDEINHVSLKSTDTAGIKAALAATGGDPFIDYTITPEDAAGPFVASIPVDYSEKAKLDRMSYGSVTEMLGERFHMDEDYLKSINPDASFSRPGTIVRVANIGQNVTTPVQNIVADKGHKQVRAYDAAGKLVAAYPATIGSGDTPSPTGIHAVSRIAFDPNYTYNPKVNFKQGENDKVLTIPPGPNGPVGSIWIALDKPTYGVHGTPDPSKIGKTESHGCVRLTNWDAAELAKLVSPGVLVEFEE